MSDVVLAALIGTFGALAGSVIGAIVAREAKKISRLERRIDRYRDDIRARQAEENVTAKWLFELNVASSELAAKRKLRERTEEETGLRPLVGPADVRI